MRYSLFLVLLLLFCLQTFGQGRRDKNSKVEAAINALLKERAAAVEARDFSRISQLYIHDEELVAIRPNTIFRGWSAYRKYWEQSLKGIPSRFWIKWNNDLVVYITTGDLVVGSLTWSNGVGSEKQQEGSLTLVLKRYGNRYLIVHEHLSYIMPG